LAGEAAASRTRLETPRGTFFSSSTDSPAQNGGGQTLNTVSAPSSRTWPDVQTFARTVFQAGVFFSLNNYTIQNR
jgi:hypothetical protein